MRYTEVVDWLVLAYTYHVASFHFHRIVVKINGGKYCSCPSMCLVYSGTLRNVYFFYPMSPLFPLRNFISLKHMQKSAWHPLDSPDSLGSVLIGRK
jgi:hypothetical protein